VLDSNEFLIRDLLDQGRLNEPDVERAKQRAAETRSPLPETLVAMGLIDARELAISRAAICECPFVDLDAFDIDIRNAELLPRAVAEKHDAFPLFHLDGTVTVGMVDPLNLRSVDQIRQSLRVEVNCVLCDPDHLRALISRAYSMASTASTQEDEDEQAELTTGAEPIVAAVNQLIGAAIDQGASDIHLNPDEHELHVRYRIDGVLQPRQGPGLAAHAGLVQRIKVMADLDLTQTRRPQDGKFRFTHRGQCVDVRVSVIPTVCGENVVLRLLRQNASLKGFDDLGMPRALIDDFRQVIHSPHGMILVTGPTGSGKTTTLYTALSELNDPHRNIMTIEDPVEIRLPMIRQTQVNPEIGLTFAGALRSILRQDPDVILVGEIRDQETAQIAAQSSLTGHLVFSTLHTNDAVGAIARLRDFGIPPFAINSAVLCAVAQRLVRQICPHCAEPDEPDEANLRAFGLSRDEATGLMRGAGCARCLNTGYQGRIGVYEMLRLTPAIQSAIEAGASTRALHETARSQGMRLMWEDGLEKARLGLTTIDELWKVRATFEDEAIDDGPDARPTEKDADDQSDKPAAVRLTA